MSPADLTIVTKNAPILRMDGSVLLAFECALDSKIREEFPGLCDSAEVFESAADLGDAQGLAAALLAEQPEFEGVRLLEVFEETLVEELAAILGDLRLHDWIKSQGFLKCRFLEPSPIRERLIRIQQECGRSFDIADGAFSPAGSHKLAEHFQKRGFGGKSVAGLFAYAAHRYFPQLSRMTFAKRSAKFPTGAAWFYSSSYTCSSIGLAYEPLIDRSLQFAYEDPATGGRRLREARHDATNFYSWARREDVIRGSEIKAAAAAAAQALQGALLSGKQKTARNIFAQSSKFQYMLSRLFVIAMLQIRVARRFLEDASPDMLVVGNAGWERTLLLQARKLAIPTVLLQHGVVHRTLGVADQPVDDFVLRGEFFQRQLCPALRQKSVVLNYVTPSSEAPTGKHPQGIVYLTAPYHQLPGYHLADRSDILRVLLLTAVAVQCPVVLRIHPLESVIEYRRLVERLCLKEQISPQVSFSQGPGLDDVIRASAVAVLHFSTAFLDCIRLRVPIISFNWHSFPFKDDYKKHHVFNFAAGLEDLAHLLRRGTNGELSPGPDLAIFLKPTAAEDARSFFESRLMKSAAH